MRPLHPSILMTAAIAAVLNMAGLAHAQGSEADPTPAWRQSLADLESTVRSLRDADRTGRERTAVALRELDTQISSWLDARGLAVDQPAAGGSQLQDLSAELSRVRALIEQARAGSRRSPSGEPETGVFFLGRFDVAVSAPTAAPGVVAVDANQMRSIDARTVTEALETAPGVTAHRGGPRNEGMAYVRGFDLRQVPLFIDGIPVYVPYDGYIDLDRFVTADLSEVRITKGLTSTLIGPNALGGAINLVTKRPTQPVEGVSSIAMASGRQRAVDSTIGVMRPGWYAIGTGSWLQTESFPLSSDFVPTKAEDGGARDHSARRDGKASMKFALTPTAHGEYAVSYVLQRGQKDAPFYAGTSAQVKPRFWRWPEWNKDSVYVVSNTPLGGSQYLRGRGYYDRFYNQLNAFDDARYATMTRASSFRSIYDDYTRGGSIEYGTSLTAGQTLRAAAHFKEDIHREYNVGEPVRHFDNRTVSAAIEDTFVLSPSVTAVVGIGIDRQTTVRAENFAGGVVSDFPLGGTSSANPQAAVFFAAPHNGRIRLDVSRKTRLPAIKDRYSYRMGTSIPNPDLRAEQATTAEAGYENTVGSFSSVSLTAFYTALDDLVQPFFLQPNLFQFRNIGNVRNAGFEGEWRVRPIHRVQGSLGYAYLHRANVGDTSIPLLNTPSHKVFAYGVYSGVSKLRLIGSVNYESSRVAQDDGGVIVPLPGYSTVSAKASYALWQGLDAEGTVSNAFDRNYQLCPGFPEPGRTLSVILRYRF